MKTFNILVKRTRVEEISVQVRAKGVVDAVNKAQSKANSRKFDEELDEEAGSRDPNYVVNVDMKIKSELEQRIDSYKLLIKEGKVNHNIPYYKRGIAQAKSILKMVNTNRMTPEAFKKLDSRDRWAVARMLTNVTWCCEECKADMGTELPESAFMGSVHCENCDAELTRRTGGGQSNPFNYTFIQNK
jgi:hypothetical protein